MARIEGTNRNDKGGKKLVGTNQSDKIFGLNGSDELLGRGGKDELDGGKGRDNLKGGSGADVLLGGPGADELFGQGGGDELQGQGGNDDLRGGGGNDDLKGNAGDDRLFGQAGNDILRGGGSDDELKGHAGNDRLFGQRGDDEMDGGPGNDVHEGGDGADRFVVSNVNHGLDRVRDFDMAEGDFVDLQGALRNFDSNKALSEYVQVRTENGDTLIAIDPTGDTGTFKDVLRLKDVGLTLDELLDAGSIVPDPDNRPPQAADDSRTTSEDTSLNFGLFANDTDPDGGDVLKLASLSAGDVKGDLQVSDGGAVAYDPRGVFDQLAAGQSATETFTYTVEDRAGLTDTASVSITVQGANDAPTAKQGQFGKTVNEGNQFTFNGPDAFSDVDDGDTLTFEFDNFPDWLNETNDGSGRSQGLQGRPDGTAESRYDIGVTATDESQASISKTLVLRVSKKPVGDDLDLSSPEGNDSDINIDSTDPSISADGRFVAFSTFQFGGIDDNLITKHAAYVKDHAEDKDPLLVSPADTDRSPPSSTPPGETITAAADPAISANGRFVAYETFENDIFDGKISLSQIDLVDVSRPGIARSVSVDEDGNLGDGDSLNPALSADGSLVVFESDAANLSSDTSNVRKILLRDLTNNTTELVSIGQDGAGADGNSFSPSISADGQRIAFQSDATNLATTNDTDGNNRSDVFVRLEDGEIVRFAPPDDHTLEARNPHISADGRFVAFETFVGSGDEASADRGKVFVAAVDNPAADPVEVDLIGREDAAHPTLSEDGSSLAYLRGNVDGDTELVFKQSSLGSGGKVILSVADDSDSQFDPSAAVLSADGTFIALQAVLVIGNLGDPESNGDGPSIFHLPTSLPETIFVQADEPLTQEIGSGPSEGGDSLEQLVDAIA